MNEKEKNVLEALAAELAQNPAISAAQPRRSFRESSQVGLQVRGDGPGSTSNEQEVYLSFMPEKIHATSVADRQSWWRRPVAWVLRLPGIRRLRLSLPAQRTCVTKLTIRVQDEVILLDCPPALLSGAARPWAPGSVVAHAEDKITVEAEFSEPGTLFVAMLGQIIK